MITNLYKENHFKKYLFFFIFCTLELYFSFMKKNYSSIKLDFIHVLIVLGILILCIHKSNYSYQDLGIHLSHPFSQLICSLFTVTVLLLSYYYLNDFQVWIYRELRLLRSMSVSYFLLALLISIYSEFVWRCFFLSFLKELTNKTFSLIFTSILCGLVYFPANPDIIHLMHTALLGFIMDYLRYNSPEKFTLFSLTIIHLLWILLH